MNEPRAHTSDVYLPHIRVGETVLTRQNDGSYTANVVRTESTVVDSVLDDGVWRARTTQAPWDMRVGQDWLRMYPKSWEPVS